MQGAYSRNIKRRSLCEKCSDRLAVFPDYPDIISARLIVPRAGAVGGGKAAESVGREKDLFAALVAHRDLGPMHHRRRDKGQSVLAERQRVAITDHNAPPGIIGAEELSHHAERLSGRNSRGGRIFIHKSDNARRMIGLHVVDYKIIRLPAAERCLNIFEPLARKVRVNSVEHGCLFVGYNI
ncbi:unknown [Anaerotruncus sp. CAG:390]|nr:unknown [Anaerotruncus sp. CAG:390]